MKMVLTVMVVLIPMVVTALMVAMEVAYLTCSVEVSSLLSLVPVGHLLLTPLQELLVVVVLLLDLGKAGVQEHFVSLLVMLIHVDSEGTVLLDFNLILTGAMPRISPAAPAARILL